MITESTCIYVYLKRYIPQRPTILVTLDSIPVFQTPNSQFSHLRFGKSVEPGIRIPRETGQLFAIPTVMIVYCDIVIMITDVLYMHQSYIVLFGL